MKEKVLFVFVAIVLAISLITVTYSAPAPTPTPTPAQTPAKVIELVYTTHVPKTHDRHVNVEDPWLNMIEKASGGRVKFIRQYANALATTMGQYDAIVSGVADIGEYMPPWCKPGVWPYEEASSIAKMDIIPERHAAIWEILYEEFPGLQDHFKDVHYIGNIPSASNVGLFFKSRVNNLNDLKGKKIQIAGKVQGELIKRLGASPVLLDSNEVFMGLEKGIIDGVGWSPDTLKSRQLAEHAKYSINISTGHFIFTVVMNKKTWNSLPADIQKVFTDYGGRYMADFADLMHNGKGGYVTKALEWAGKKKGVTFYDLEPNEMAKWLVISDKLRDDFIAEWEAKGVKDMRKFITRWHKLTADPYYRYIANVSMNNLGTLYKK